jgi:hypothetical protein
MTMLYKNYLKKLILKNISYAFIFLLISFLLMRYYAYLGNPTLPYLGRMQLQYLNSRGILTFLIYVIFNTILYSATRKLSLIEGFLFVLLITFLIAFCDTTVDYITGFGFSWNSLLINTSSVILSYVLIILHKIIRI